MKKMRIISLSLSLLLVASVFVPSFLAKPAVAQLDPIKIGVFTPNTFPLGLWLYAPWTKQGFELGMIYATTEMGYDNENMTQAGRPYEIHYYDTQGSTTYAAQQAIDAIEIDGIDIMVGGTSSAVAAVLSGIAEDNEKLYFITPAVASSLTGEDFNPYIFRIGRNSWHDAYAGVTYAMDESYLNHSKFAFLGIDYSFGYDGVNSMKTVIEDRGGSVLSIQYAPGGATDFSPYILNLLAVDTLYDIDYLFIIWAGDFSYLFTDLATYIDPVDPEFEIAGSCVDILSMNLIEDSLTDPDATIIGGTGLCVYGYNLPNNAVNDWMVDEHVTRNIMPNVQFPWFQTYRVPELFTPAAFATAQFLVDVTNAIPDLDTELMINYLEGGITINTPKGPTYLRPDDHQGLSEMYIATAVNDTNPTSETYNEVIAELNVTLDRNTVAPPIEAMWNGEPYVPGGFAPITTTTTTTGTGTTTPPPVGFDILTVSLIGVGGIVVGVIVAAVIFRKR
ncbi:MAG: ABC transporter substrate-binding protein [Candidatus Thorarchaeota archaeon]